MEELFLEASSAASWMIFVKECTAVSKSDGYFKEMLRLMAFSIV